MRYCDDLGPESGASSVLYHFLMGIEGEMAIEARASDPSLGGPQHEFIPPMIPLLRDTAAGADIEMRRAFLLVDAAARTFAPMALDGLGYPQPASRLRGMAPIVDVETAEAAAEQLERAMAVPGVRGGYDHFRRLRWGGRAGKGAVGAAWRATLAATHLNPTRAAAKAASAVNLAESRCRANLERYKAWRLALDMLREMVESEHAASSEGVSPGDYVIDEDGDVWRVGTATMAAVDLFCVRPGALMLFPRSGGMGGEPRPVKPSKEPGAPLYPHITIRLATDEEVREAMQRWGHRFTPGELVKWGEADLDLMNRYADWQARQRAKGAR